MTMLMDNTLVAQNVRLSQEGDHDAFGQLILMTQNTITSIALAIVRDIDSSEDVAQKAYIAAWHQIQDLKNPHSFLPWLRQITRNVAKNFLRDNKVSQRLTSEETETLLAQFCDSTNEPEMTVEREQISALIGEFISQMPAESRELVLLYYREQQNTAQVAELLGISETNARKRLSRARAALKQDILAVYGKWLLSTVPTVTFSSAVLTGMGFSSPVAAASLATTMTGSKSGLLTKLVTLLSGAMIGSLMGVLAVFLSSKIVIRKLKDQDAKRLVITYRNYMIGWLFFSGILLAIAYEMTAGWWAPVLVYLIFSVGMIKYMYNLRQIINKHIFSNSADNWRQTIAKLCSTLGTTLGIAGGFAGLIIGLVNSGRLVW